VVIYLHGFASCALSRKGRELEAGLAPITVLRPTYPRDPALALPWLHAFIRGAVNDRGGSRLLLVGSSLGGFYAQHLATVWNCGLALINPALEPASLLRPFLGENRVLQTGESFLWTQTHLAALADLGVPKPRERSAPTLVLLDSGDELIEPSSVVTRYWGVAELVIFPGGDHGFVHLQESLAAIRRCHEASRIICP